MRRAAPFALILAALALRAAGAPAQPASAPADSLGAAAPPAVTHEDSLRAATEQAQVDSLNAYWRNLDSGWYQPLTPEALKFGLSGSALDSLSGKGDRELDAITRGERWRWSIDPLARLAFNRVEGWRPGAALTAQRLGRFQPRVVLGAGYGFSRKRVVADGLLTLPLIAAKPPDQPAGFEADHLPPRPWQVLALELSAESTVRPFGGAAGITHSLNSLATGSDKNSYFQRDAVLTEFVWHPWPLLGLRAGGIWERHLPLPLATRWSFGGNRDDIRPNVQIPPFSSRGLTAAIDWRWSRLSVWLRNEWHWTSGNFALEPPQPGDPEIPGASGAPLDRLTAGLRGIWIDGAGNELEVRGLGWTFDRQPPLEWRTFLGGSQTLRGYPAQELAGDRAALGSVDLRLGADPFRAIHAPVLGKLGLQPILFADWAATSAIDGPRAFSGLTNTTGWRADAGLGIGKLIGIPGFGGWLRFYFAHPVFNGQAGRPWQIQIEIEG